MRLPTTFMLVMLLCTSACIARGGAMVTCTPLGAAEHSGYINSDGNCIHRPVASNARSAGLGFIGQTAPAGATAQCRDGAYSFSQHRSGTCSGHGGVNHWIR